MCKISFEKENWNGLDCIHVQNGPYEGRIIPRVGGNLIELRHKDYDINILHKPSTKRQCKDKKMHYAYGMPVLFPPNRLDEGKFSFNDKLYKFPIRDRKNKNSLHGFLSRTKWEVTKQEIIDNKNICVELTYKHNKKSRDFKSYPHNFVFKLTYKFTREGVYQEAYIKNMDNEPMPLLLGYHTTFNLLFHPRSKKERIRLRLSIGRRIELNERSLPIGMEAELKEHEAKMRDKKGYYPLYEALDHHYTANNIVKDKDNLNFHGAILEDTQQKIRIIYEVDQIYKYWMIWNNNKNGKYISIEPQTCKINAPNLISPKKSGLIIIKPREEFQATSKIYCEKDS
ncbi:MAG: aldose 1-epimerase [Eubacteriales bacterium]